MKLWRNREIELGQINGKDFEGVCFEGCQFPKERIHFTSFNECEFNDCDLSGGQWDGVYLSDCVIKNSKMSYSDFSEVTIKKCRFPGSILRECFFGQFKDKKGKLPKIFDLRGCEFEGTMLDRSIFLRCDLRAVSFKGASLEHVIFEKANLTETILVGVKFEGIGFNECKVEKTLVDIPLLINYGRSKGFRLEGES